MVKPETAQQPGALRGGTLNSALRTLGVLNMRRGTKGNKIVWKYKHFHGYVNP